MGTNAVEPESREGWRMGEHLLFMAQLIITGIAVGSVYALMALGFVLIFKASSVVNFGPGELVLFGAYVAWATILQMRLPAAVALPLTLGVAVLLGLVSVRGGVDFSLAELGLKVFPVVILGGLDSVAGAIIGGVLIGVLENLSGGYLDPVFGGGVKEVAPFVVLVLILMIRPYGLFGRRDVERV